jgi:hypothetical protein
MSKDLYYTIPRYFLERMHEHSGVLSLEDVSTDDAYLYRIRRTKYGEVLVWLSDAYKFTDMDFINRPDQLTRGDYIIIAKPEGGGGAARHLIEDAEIGVGKLADFMGALNKREIWNYVAPTWEEKQNKKRRF